MVRKYLRNKRGVSPLIATVLLISFAVALGAVVMNWGRNIDLGESDKCRGVSIKIRNIENAEICFGGSGVNGYVNFILDNGGSRDIEGLGVWIVGERGTKLFDLDEVKIRIGQLFEAKNDAVIYDFNEYGAIKHVQFIPKIKGENGVEICPKNSVRATKNWNLSVNLDYFSYGHAENNGEDDVGSKPS